MMITPGWYMVNAPALERLAPYTWDWGLEHHQFVYVMGVNAAGEADCQLTGVTSGALPVECLIAVTEDTVKGFTE